MTTPIEAPAPRRESAPGGHNPLPRWRGFNLLEFFQAFSEGEQSSGMVREDDLRWMRDWGFDFARIPMDYWLWIDSDWRETRTLTPDDAFKIDESMLEKVDRTVELGQQYGIHISLNFHRAPGYCINERTKREPFSLWSDPVAEDAFVYHWDVFARRYRGISNQHLSFNLLNEAPRPREGYMTREDYRRVMTRATEKIRESTPDRLVIIDGLSVGNEVVPEMIPTGVAQSVHAYRPAGISHFRAPWVDRDSRFPPPSWPLRREDGSIELDRRGLEEHYAPWGELARQGIGVHCGEGGAYNKTPHPVFLAWMEDVLDILKGHGIGWALWNFRGSFGVLDSNRADVKYEP
ncbi:MAG: cellulase family glycosylhydrolase, partial [Armatimonadota bacterium]|nr:cellulase family glycosylhydrolase [Armatimonadota bacterium]